MPQWGCEEIQQLRAKPAQAGSNRSPGAALGVLRRALGGHIPAAGGAGGSSRVPAPLGQRRELPAAPRLRAARCSHSQPAAGACSGRRLLVCQARARASWPGALPRPASRRGWAAVSPRGTPGSLHPRGAPQGLYPARGLRVPKGLRSSEQLRCLHKIRISWDNSPGHCEQTGPPN